MLTSSVLLTMKQGSPQETSRHHLITWYHIKSGVCSLFTYLSQDVKGTQKITPSLHGWALKVIVKIYCQTRKKQHTPDLDMDKKGKQPLSFLSFWMGV